MYQKIANDKLLDLTGKTAIVTGSAGGIGKAIALRLHEAGANVVIADLNQSGSDDVAHILNEQRESSALGYGLDVTNAEAVDSLTEHVVREFGSIDILVNNAGIFPFISLAEMTDDTFSHVIDVNLRGVFLLTKVVSEVMKEHKTSGKIINVTSIDAIHPSMVGLAHYDASKHAVWGFTKNIALELMQYGITVNAIAPGGIATPGVGSTDGEQVAGLGPFLKQIPMGRMGNADEIAKAALFLASDMASYMTGEQVVVDGGRLLS